MNVCGGKYGFQRGLSLTVISMDVNALVISGRKKITTLHLSKAYDKVVKRRLIEDYEQMLNSEIIKMLT